jgi:integrase
MVKTLTDRFIAGVRPTGPFLDVNDKQTRGLTLRVGARSKVWYFTYRNNGPSQRLRLGEYPALSLADARKQVNEQRALLDKGVDPAAEKKAALEAAKLPPPPAAPVMTVQKWARGGFLTFQKGTKKTWHEDELKLEKYIIPAWGELPLESITKKMVAALLADISAEGLTVGVNRVQMVISRMFAVAINQGVIDQEKANPAAKLFKLFSENARERVLTEDEIRRLYAELTERPSEAADVVWLRLVLGQRGGETAGMRWDELDLAARTWLLPKGRTKNKREHLLWLPDLAIDLITRRRKALPDTELRVFPSMAGNNEDRRDLYGVAATFDNFDWRDLRRTFSTGLGSLGIDDGVIDRLLNHAAATIGRKHYNHAKYLPEKQVALEAWDRELGRILRNEPKRKTVVPIRARR